MLMLYPHLSPAGVGGHPRQVTVIGAGGIGARLVPLLVKALSPQDHIDILDFDIVGPENLNRQNFAHCDLGRYKAEVLASRYNGHNDITVTARLARVQDYWPASTAHFPCGDGGLAHMIIGCVDNTPTRQHIHTLITSMLSRDYSNIAYLDAGNAMRTGQTVLMGGVQGHVGQYGTRFLAQDPYKPLLESFTILKREVPPTNRPYRIRFDGITDLYPALIEPETADATPACGMRMDTQSVVANAWAALAVFNMALWFINGMPVPNLGITFNATTGTAQGHPVQYLAAAPDHEGRRDLYAFATRERLNQWLHDHKDGKEITLSSPSA